MSEKNTRKMLGKCQRALILCGTSTAIDCVAILCGMETLNLRREKLFARMLIKCWKHEKFKKEDFSIGYAIDAYERYQSKGSIIDSWKENKILSIYTQRPRPCIEPTFNQIVDMRKEEDIKETLSKYQALKFLRNESISRIKLFVRIFNQLNYPERNMIFSFLFNKFHRKLKCHNCGLENTTTNHVMCCRLGEGPSIQYLLEYARSSFDLAGISIRCRNMLVANN